MSRQSRSPPRRRARYGYDDDSRDARPRDSKVGNGYNGRHNADEKRNERYDQRKFDDDGRPGRDRDGGRSQGEERRRDYGLDNRRREYQEHDRERERARDRDRYEGRGGDRDKDKGRNSYRDGDRDRPGPSTRRSASPRSRQRSARAPSPSGSRSASPADKAKPNFAPSGLLAAETNTIKAVDGSSTVLKYNEPPEARKPLLGWRLYVFKGSEQVELLHIHRQSAYLIGRDRLVADIAVDHPSCSKQHAVIQYRYVQEKDEFGGSKSSVKPFIIDLESTNGTHVNEETIPVSRYYELKPSDVIKFGQSTREYVLLHDDAA